MPRNEAASSSQQASKTAGKEVKQCRKEGRKQAERPPSLAEDLSKIALDRISHVSC